MTTKISALTAVTAAAETDQHEVNQGGVSKRATNTQILSLRGLQARASRTSTGQTVNAATADIIDFNTVNYDPGSDITTGASWHWTCPETGWYNIVIVDPLINPLGTTWAAGEGASIETHVNGAYANEIGYEESDGTAGTDHWLFPNGSGALSLTAGDTVALKYNNLSSQQRRLSVGSAIEIYRVA